MSWHNSIVFFFPVIRDEPKCIPPKAPQGEDAKVFEHAYEVATLPGLVGYSLCMPDGHRRYDFPILGGETMEAEGGLIFPWKIGFDTNCAMCL